MIRRSTFPMVHAAQRLPWHVALPAPKGGLGHDLNLLLAWCRERFAEDAWFWPGPGGLWCFAERDQASAFAAEAERLLGLPAAIRDSRGTAAPPWSGAP